MARFLEFLLTGAIGALLWGLAALGLGFVLWKAKTLLPDGWPRWAIVISLVAPLLGLGILTTAVSLYHSVVFVKLNGRLPPLFAFSVEQPAPGSIPQKPLATFTMEDGRSFVVELDPYAAPDTVNSFIHLARSGFFDGTVFRRLEKDRLIELADPEMPLMEDLLLNPGYVVSGEFPGNGYPNPRTFERGDIGLAMMFGRTANPGGVFIMNSPAPDYVGMMPAFGAVVEGMDVVDELNGHETTRIAGFAIALEPEVIRSVTIDTFGIDYPAPVKLPDTQIAIQRRIIRKMVKDDPAMEGSRERR